MYLGKKISIVFPVYNEKENIRNAIEEFLAHPAVDEIIAVDNNSKDGSDVEIKNTSAVYVLETTQGYGAALRRGMSEATGDLIVTCEPDGTFRASDLDRLLVYSLDYDVVFGTRTARNPVWSDGDPGVNMDFALRMGNWSVAKLLEFLFNGPSLTDVGCTFKLIHRRAYEHIKDAFTVDGNWFSPEFMLRALEHKLSVVEIPVQYGARVGTSKITGKRSKAILLGLRMIRFIVVERIRSWMRPTATHSAHE
ncbi:glycosyltransferase family 2 protein [Candidatus Kaiserbacteria bacterium CG10_big_fil_rev_8_21_14_0_10_56_12]|uniref:Glycosyltransferase family 2 protein n=1 Tax=Candidatus Kaiserbacteria bacterium CG10_big_fil_rev_8_21_14_0_10_56_12 TaxID=1974611 RepID=A0A2H0UAJ8_9BACT|nr:MAG: glycosyltransferase family 2 protein [Candidatus Kaiserbacteria bacterium CG10_big_fil_rev_8_21_14_0_10_56_12]